ncbi:hypothetical protein DBR41_14990, partial [Pseudomonas sp. HMWF010]
DCTHNHSTQKGTNHTRSQTNHKFCPPLTHAKIITRQASLPSQRFGYILYSYCIFIISFIYFFFSFFQSQKAAYDLYN